MPSMDECRGRSSARASKIDCRNRLHGSFLQIVVASVATTRWHSVPGWKSRPQHRKRTNYDRWLSDDPIRMSWCALTQESRML
jgi:hypothetical protein